MSPEIARRAFAEHVEHYHAELRQLLHEWIGHTIGAAHITACVASRPRLRATASLFGRTKEKSQCACADTLA